MDLLIQALVQGVLVGSTYAVIALGMGLIFSVSGIINFAHGDLIVIAMFMCLSAFTALKVDPYLALAVTVPAMVVLAAALYRFLLRRMIGRPFLITVQLTLGLSFMIQSLLLMFYGGEPQRVPSLIEAQIWLVGDIVFEGKLVVAFAVSVVLSVLLFWMLNYTDFGRSVRAIRQNAKAAALMGINVERARLKTFMLGIGVLALAGSLLVPGMSIQPTAGLHLTVITLLAVVLGGMSNFAGILIGGIVIGIAEAFGSIYVSGTLGLIFPYLIFVAILLFRPAGILGRSQ